MEERVDLVLRCGRGDAALTENISRNEVRVIRLGHQLGADRVVDAAARVGRTVLASRVSGAGRVD